jgi:hypothetical protein
MASMRAAFLLLLTALCFLCTGCSYITDFVVVNGSTESVTVRYRIKQFPGEFGLPVKPATLLASRLDSHGGQQWNILSSDAYHVDAAGRTVSVSVGPGDALRIADVSNYGSHDDTWNANEFPIDEITISGANGDLRLTGQQTRTTFAKVSLALYTLTYK